jgi:hypothetical protein
LGSVAEHIRFEPKRGINVKWFSVSSEKRRPEAARRGVKRTGLVFIDNEGGEWNVSVFRRSSVGAWWSEEDWDWSRELAVVFEQDGEERVAVADRDHDFDSEGSLADLFSNAIDRRSGSDRRGGLRAVPFDRRGKLARRWTDT